METRGWFRNHWLIARTGEEIVAREVFSRFKQYASFDAKMPMIRLVEELSRAAGIYRRFVEAAKSTRNDLSRAELFSYRTSVLESEVIKPVVLVLQDPELPPIPDAQLTKSYDILESWLVRRMLVRATTKSYTQLMAELVAKLRGALRAEAGAVIEGWLSAQSGVNSYWPDDDEMRRELASLLAYRRLGRGRLRMVLEAIEDHLRGWVGGAQGLGVQRVVRGELAIEHVLPRKWQPHWQLSPGVTERERESLLHTLGNLTLLGKRLNATVSNGPWKPAGGKGKRAALEEHDVFMVNRQLLRSAGDSWTDADIRERTQALTEVILKIWPVPAGHRSSFAVERASAHRKIEVVDLITAGLLAPGTTLLVRRKQHRDRTATLLQDGSVDVDGTLYPTLSAAAMGINGTQRNGWYFFAVEEHGRRVKLKDLRDRLLEQLADGGDDDDESDNEDDDDD